MPFRLRKPFLESETEEHSFKEQKQHGMSYSDLHGAHPSDPQLTGQLSIALVKTRIESIHGAVGRPGWTG